MIGSCVGFWVLGTRILQESAKWSIFGVLILLACVEKPCSVLNMVAVERDWVCLSGSALNEHLADHFKVVVIAGHDDNSLQSRLPTSMLGFLNGCRLIFVHY